MPRRALTALIVLVVVAACRSTTPSEDVAPPRPRTAPPVARAPEPVVEPAAPLPREVAAAPDVVAPPPARLTPEEVAAHVSALRSSDDVLRAFLTTPDPAVRHALMVEKARSSITPEGLRTFHEEVPGLLDLPLPLAPDAYDVKALPSLGKGWARYRVTLPATDPAARTEVAWYTLREEAGAWRVVWDRRAVAAARLVLVKGQYEEAQSMAEAVLRWSPACGDCRELIFWSMSRRMSGAKAYQMEGVHILRAVELEPDSASHQNALGVYYRNLRQYGRARQAFERSVALDPDSPAGGNLALLLESEGREKEALAAADAFVARNPSELWGHLTKCRLLKRLARFADAAKACQAAVDLRQPTDEVAHAASAYYLLAVALRELGRKDEALAAAERAVQLRPTYWMYLDLRNRLAK